MFTIILLIQVLTKAFAIDCFNRAAFQQITRIRIAYFESLLRQEIGWYDVFGSNNNFTVRNTEWVDSQKTTEINFQKTKKKLIKLQFSFRDIERIRDGISEKVSFFLLQLMSVFVSLTVAFYYGWKLTLVVISYVPIALITNSIIEKVSILAVQFIKTYHELTNMLYFIVQPYLVSSSFVDQRTKCQFDCSKCGWGGLEQYSNGIFVWWWKSRNRKI